jgi:predicted Zn-dependent protease
MGTTAVADQLDRESNTSGGGSRLGGGAGILVVLGLLLLAGGAVAYIMTSTAPQASPTAFHPRGVPDRHAPPLTTEAFDTILNSTQRLINEGKNAEAEAIFRNVTASHPEAQAVRVQYARFLAANKRPQEAYAQYREAIKAGPVEPEVQLEAGTAAHMAGDLKRALEHYQDAQTAAPTDYRAPLFLAQVQIKLKQVDAAKANLLLVTGLKPDAAAPAWSTLAQLALDDNKPDVALTYLAHARELDPKSTVYRVLAARALKRTGDPTAALELLIGLTDAEKREPGVMQVMAECFGMLQRPADAAKMYSDASDAQPTEGKYAFEAAVWLEKAGDKPKAAEYAKRAAILNVEGAAQLADRLAK